MVRPLRIEYPGAFYHVTARGDRRGSIYRDDADRTLWLDTLAEVCARFHFAVHAYCLMGNHYHLLVETERGRLSTGMQQLNSVYSQAYNRRHNLVGHVFQGRYGAILCEKDRYLMELARYIVLNPVRAKLVETADAWPWSSHRILLGDEDSPPWFDATYLLACFSEDATRARGAYVEFIRDGLAAKRPLDEVKHQICLGNVPLAQSATHKDKVLQSREIARQQRQALAPPIAQRLENIRDRSKAIIEAYASGCYSMAEIARHFGLSRNTVARIIREHEAAGGGDGGSVS